MIVNADFLAGLFTNFRAIAMRSMAEANRIREWAKIAVQIDSQTSEENYNWLGSVPAMNEWLDERQVYGTTGFNYPIRNRSFESTIAVDRDTLADDRMGLIRPRIEDLGRRAALFPDELVFGLLSRGETVNAFDNIPYFATTRAFGDSGNISNIVTGSGVTEVNIRTDLATAIARMGLFNDDRGRPLNLIRGPAPVVIVCPVQLAIPIRSALLPSVAGVNRAEAGFVQEIIPNAFLTDPNDWYVLAVNQVMKPLIFQLREAPRFVALDKAASSELFMRKQLLYGIDMRCNVGFTDPRYGILVKNV